MRLLNRLSVPTQTRLSVLLALTSCLALIGASGYMVLLYENYRQDLAEVEAPLFMRITESNKEMASIQRELITLIDGAKLGLSDEESMYRTGRQLIDRYDNAMVDLPERLMGSGPEVQVEVGNIRSSIAEYRGNLVSAVEMLSVDTRMAEKRAQLVAKDALAFNLKTARLQSLISQHLTSDAQALRASLLKLVIPTLVFVLIMTLGLFVILHRLSSNIGQTFSFLQQTMARLRTGDTAAAIVPATEFREAADIAASLESFRQTLIDLGTLRSNLESEVADRTEQLKHANVELSEQIAKLFTTQRELRLFKRVFESTAEAIIITRLDGTIVEVNDAYVAITGYDRDEIAGMNPRMASSGRHDAEFYAAMWNSIRDTGRWTGEIWDKRRNGEIFPKLLSINTVYDEAQQPSHYVGVFTDISAIKEAEAELERMAYFDRLTGLPNRRLLLDRVEHALSLVQRGGGIGAMFFLDLDRFKQINDTLGHSVGDELLKEVAHRIKACVRDMDTVGRLAGDEFIVVVESLPAAADKAAWLARAIGEKILSALAAPYPIGDKTVHTSSSVGVVLFDGVGINGVEDLINKADTAMYEAKKRGRNTLCFFDPDMQEKLRARVALEGQLRSAVAEQRFELHLQPQFDAGAAIVGVEALIRMRGVDGQPISPQHFIPMAEESLLIQDIGRWVLHEACRLLKRWEQDASLARIPIAINVSGKHFSDKRFIEETCAILAEHGVSPSRLKLELTESVVVANVEESISRMRELQRLGFALAMDDFGTGHSSLSYLKRLPFDQIKIDRSFVSSMLESQHDMFIVHSVLTMADLLGADVVAEGVETEAQRDTLLAQGCGIFQGYLFSKPLPIDACEVFLRAVAEEPSVALH